jgi:hypothetical protein
VPVTWHGVSTYAEAGEWVVHFRGLAGSPQAEEAAVQGRLLQAGRANLHVAQELGSDGLFLIDASAAQSPQDVQGALVQLPGYDYAEPNFILQVADTFPNDPLFGLQDNLFNAGQNGGTPGADIHAPKAWDITTGSRSIVVAEIDSGVDYNHPDLAANMWTNPADGSHGYNFVNNTNNPLDDNGHGTHVAGIIGAQGDNGAGVAGVNWNVQIMALKAADAQGSLTEANEIRAVNYATAMRNQGVNVRVINASWGGTGYSQGLRDAIQASGNAGLLFVAAAGNNGSNNDASPFYPASYNLPNIISVAATDNTDRLAGFSNYGANSVHLAAPGVGILSTWPGGGYAYLSGTSMATPHVTGAAALAWGVTPQASYQEIRTAILNTAEGLPSLAGRTVTGGRLNAHMAVLGRLQYELQPNGDLMRVVGGSRILTDRNVQSFAAANNGTVYYLKNDGGLWQYDGITRLLAQHVQSFAVLNGGANVFALQINGDLILLNAGSWSVYDHGVQAIAGSGGPAVFDLHTDGRLFAQYADSPDHRLLLDADVQAIAGSGSASVFDLHTDGRLFAQSIGGGPATFLDNAVQAIAGSGGPACFELVRDGRLFAHYYDGEGDYTFLDNAVQAIAGSGGPACFELLRDGRLFAHYYDSEGDYTLLDNAVQAIAGSGGPACFELQTDGRLFAHYYDGEGDYTFLDNAVQAIASSGGPAVFDLHTDGRLFAQYFDSAGHYDQLDSGVQVIAGSGGPAVFDLHTDGTLYAQYIDSANHSTQVDSGVQAFVLGPGGLTVDVLKTDGNLYQHHASDWTVSTLLDQNVQSIWLTDGGYTLVAQEYDGTIHQFVA